MLEIYEKNKSLLKNLSFFPLLTLIAFLYFDESDVDYAIIEAGVGGLKDTTNIINPCLSIITNISLDHNELLGDSIESIARHKAGIIKQNIPVVLGPKACHSVCYNVAKEKNSRVIQVDSHSNKSVTSDFVLENKKIANAALLELGVKPLDEIYSLPVRFEKHDNIIFDMAHNKAAFLALGEKIKRKYKDKNVIAIWNMSHAKEVEACLKILKSYVNEVYFFSFDSNRLISEEKAQELNLKKYTNQKADIIVVCGSIYYMAAAKKHLLNMLQ